MRTSVTHKETQTHTFPLTDTDILRIANDLTKLKDNEMELERKKQLISNEIKKIKTVAVDKLNHIATRQEPRDVECDVVFNYESRTIETFYQGEMLNSRTMSDWEYSCRPEDIFPDKKKEAKKEEAAEPTPEERAEEIAVKEANMVAKSADVKAPSEAKSETSVIINAANI